MARRSLSEQQFNTLAVLAQNPDDYCLVWSGCGAAAFGCGKDPANRFLRVIHKLILSVPERYRWPCANTLKSLKRRGLIRETAKGRYYFYELFKITRKGLAAHKSDPAFDAKLTSP
jgi:hypothetical protein